MCDGERQTDNKHKKSRGNVRIQGTPQSKTYDFEDKERNRRREKQEKTKMKTKNRKTHKKMKGMRGAKTGGREGGRTQSSIKKRETERKQKQTEQERREQTDVQSEYLYTHKYIVYRNSEMSTNKQLQALTCSLQEAERESERESGGVPHAAGTSQIFVLQLSLPYFSQGLFLQLTSV